MGWHGLTLLQRLFIKMLWVRLRCFFYKRLFNWFLLLLYFRPIFREYSIGVSTSQVVNFRLNICVCYLQVDLSTKQVNKELFFDTLLSKVYEYKCDSLFYIIYFK